MEATLSPSNSLANTRPTGWKRWTARVVGAVLVLFLLVDAVGKILRLAPYVQGTVRVGYSDGVLVPLGLVLLACTILYVIPRTAVLGAILLTGYLGGATATHVRIGESAFLMPVIFGVLLWGCLYLRDERLRALLPLVSAAPSARQGR